MDFESVELLVKCVTLYYAARESVVAGWQILQELWSACVGVWSDKRYVIFEGIPCTAYNLQAVQPWATGSATPRWLVNHTQKEFWPWEDASVPASEQKAYALPFLSMEIVGGGSRVHYDLTEYVSELRVRRAMEGAATIPTIVEIVAAWAAASQIVLHPTRFTIRVITELGDTESYTLRGQQIADNYESLPASESESESESKKDE